MSTVRVPKPVSREEFLAGIHDKEQYGRCEYRDGTIVSEDPDIETLLRSPLRPHAHAQTWLAAKLVRYMESNPIAGVCAELRCEFPGHRILLSYIAVVSTRPRESDSDADIMHLAPELVVEVHKAGGRIEDISAEGSFTGDDWLPGLQIPLASILPPERSR